MTQHAGEIPVIYTFMYNANDAKNKMGSVLFENKLPYVFYTYLDKSVKKLEIKKDFIK